MKITHDLNKGKGHMFNYDEESSRLQRRSIHGDKLVISALDHSLHGERSDDNSQDLSCSSRPLMNNTTIFKVGTGGQSLSSGVGKSGRKARRCPPAWQRRSGNTIADSNAQADSSSQDGSAKRKAENRAAQGASKSSKTNSTTVASGLKPLPSQ